MPREESLRFESWADRQVREAMERGEFDNLPGAGKPIPGLGGAHDPDWWVKQWVARNGGAEAALPPSLLLRKQRDELQRTLADVRSEREAREIVEVLNERIRESHRHRLPGPPVVVATVDVEAAITQWRTQRAR